MLANAEAPVRMLLNEGVSLLVRIPAVTALTLPIFRSPLYPLLSLCIRLL